MVANKKSGSPLASFLHLPLVEVVEYSFEVVVEYSSAGLVTIFSNQLLCNKSWQIWFLEIEIKIHLRHILN